MITLEDINIIIEEIKKNNSRECISIVIEENNSLNLTDSKFGGLPYVSTDEDIPKDSNGNQLALLAQINCSDLPENTLYPKEGLLQFWISRNDDFGLDNKKDYCVKYIKNIENNITIENILNKYNLLNEENSEEYSPFNKKNTSFALKFEKGISTITQWDPRNPEEKDAYGITLLQVESHWDNDSNSSGIMWGDSGVANFFINKEKLEHLNFEDVLFNWDCL